MKFPTVETPTRTMLRSGDERYVKSFLLLRLLIGVVGLALPFLLVFGDRVLPGGGRLRESLSGYYYSGVRDVFVGSLCAIAVFLVTYMAFFYVWDNVLSIVGGIAALGVALFPTAGPMPRTPIQQWWGEQTVSTIHLTCAAVFILSLAAISFLFGYREGRKDGAGKGRRVWWRSLHWFCGVVIVLAVVYVAVTKWTGRFESHSLLYGEAVAALAFGVSWLAKGAEWRILFSRTAPAVESRDGAWVVAADLVR